MYCPHPDDPSKYYICIGDNPILMSCPAEHIWSMEALRCDEVIPESKIRKKFYP